MLHELTPLKELFLQQRPPRLLLAGAGRWPMPQVVNLLFNGVAVETPARSCSRFFDGKTLRSKIAAPFPCSMRAALMTRRKKRFAESSNAHQRTRSSF